MEYRRLGKAGIRVSALSLGGWVTYGKQVGDDVAQQCIEEAWNHGVNFFDTAEVYADGRSEIDMGKAFKNLGLKRSDLVIATKLFWGGKGVNDQGLSRKHIIEGTKASLERLGTDYVDLIFAHRPDNETPIEETVRAFNYLIDHGLAFYWGTSEWSAQQITEAHRVADRLGLVGPSMEQPQYNMFERERFEKEYAPLYRDFGMGTTIWSPLASGVLSGKYNSLTVPAGSRFALDDALMKSIANRYFATEEGKVKIEKTRALLPIAEQVGGTTAQLALAWCLKNPNVSTVITGASRKEQVTENMGALKLVDKLSPDVLEKIEKILSNKPDTAFPLFRR
ncbi:Aldo/keto reductase [Gonapodya prolifera JEL478]|uniref:Aldo/keto reductase n=1 Tax=Gonapodya prolifera (strain JEL478) TaxID=1344416 RepID=A0A139AC90_GONPJ|nr:Aldo/keto reductase [Gonapodya prolifera JEL478]|eukprot:KXS14043.1 Aldo/keto reductase [Gonapodya prolifera JEL478]